MAEQSKDIFSEHTKEMTPEQRTELQEKVSNMTEEELKEFSDVMAGVITLGLGVITFFIKGWFNNLKSSTEEIKKQIRENDEKVNKRIDKLEEETDRDIANIKQELNDIKGDFATTFVLREDFFRSMNGVENSIRSIDNKIDKILMQNSGRKE